MWFAICLVLFQDAGKPAEKAAFGTDELGIAAEVNGLQFSEKELALMLPEVLDRLKDFEKLRAVPISNDIAPALVFLPAPEVLRQPKGADARPQLYGGPPPKRPANLDDLVYEPIGVLHELLQLKLVSCEELTHTYLARLKRLDPQLHCVVTLTEERALAQARALDAEIAAGKMRGMLHGLPWVAKDLLAVKGYPTTWGTPPFKDRKLDVDAAVVEKLDAAGAILIAKVSLGELAMGDVWFGGMTRNPWKLDQGSSGSSAGTASSVSAGCAVFGIGSETLGSIVSPSTVCGNSSLRPSFGQISRWGAMTLSWSMDKLGPLAHSAEDAAFVFSAIHGHDPRDPSTVDVPLSSLIPADVHGWKVGVPKGAFEGDKRDKNVLDELKKLGVELVDVELPKYPVDEMVLVLTAEAGAAFDDFSRGDQDDQMVRQGRDAWPNTFRQAALIPAVDYIRANRLRSLLIRDYEQALAGVKAIVYPSFTGSLLAATNLTGEPTFVAPCGFREDGTPFSVSFTARLYRDEDLLALATAWQNATTYHLQHPKL